LSNGIYTIKREEKEYVAAVCQRSGGDAQVWVLTDDKRLVAMADEGKLIFVTDMDALMQELSLRAPVEEGFSFTHQEFHSTAVLYTTPKVESETPINRVIELCKKYGSVRLNVFPPKAWQSAGIYRGGICGTYIYDPDKARKDTVRQKRKTRYAVRCGYVPFKVLLDIYMTIARILYKKLDFIRRIRSPQSARLAISELPKLIHCLRAIQEPFENKDYVKFLWRIRQFRHGILRRAKTYVRIEPKERESLTNFGHWIKQEIHRLCAYTRQQKPRRKPRKQKKSRKGEAA
jgi:hypothetical protein